MRFTIIELIVSIFKTTKTFIKYLKYQFFWLHRLKEDNLQFLSKATQPSAICSFFTCFIFSSSVWYLSADFTKLLYLAIFAWRRFLSSSFWKRPARPGQLCRRERQVRVAQVLRWHRTEVWLVFWQLLFRRSSGKLLGTFLRVEQSDLRIRNFAARSWIRAD